MRSNKLAFYTRKMNVTMKSDEFHSNIHIPSSVNKIKLARSSLSLIGIFLFCYVLNSFYVIYQIDYRDNLMKNLNDNAVQLQQSVSKIALSEKRQLDLLDKQMINFRKALLETKTQVIGQNINELNAVLLEADAFTDDMDEFLASLYSIERVVAQLKYLIDKSESVKFKQFIYSISQYLLFERLGLNGKYEKRAQRFNQYITDIEKQLSEFSNQADKIEIHIIYTGLERLNRELEYVDNVINHPFMQKMSQLQIEWKEKRFMHLYNVIYALGLVFLLYGVYKVFLATHLYFFQLQNMTSQKLFSERKESSCLAKEPSFVEQNTPVIFSTELLIEQFEDDTESIKAILKVFVEEHQFDAQKLRQFIQENRIKDAYLLAHTLKSVAGNIGAITLEQICHQIEKPLREGAAIEPQTIELVERVLLQTIEKIAIKI